MIKFNSILKRIMFLVIVLLVVSFAAADVLVSGTSPVANTGPPVGESFSALSVGMITPLSDTAIAPIFNDGVEGVSSYITGFTAEVPARVARRPVEQVVLLTAFGLSSALLISVVILKNHGPVMMTPARQPLRWINDKANDISHGFSLNLRPGYPLLL